ncbi:RsmE family RNA methyltransferase [Peptoniphilus indolicus]|uniref:Ribosomal RNA small subunit methyltransferase E n=2 Tax=Peptoniphilus indolicus TaxID=33030 RepID=G4D4I0_9FIRM|nr:RsmE family RNA methyltransferase [Peptoniphilus indolicus]EGY79527.1 RsmE family RNA methyltransferase [Peptoniphilus indolicus ATCC 29427]SUB76000.1 Ribosomal RNA small subunit methyltransferase E [Peptoniphilus indolicus]
MYRFFGKLIESDKKIILDKQNSHHFMRVLRISGNEEVEAVTESGIFKAIFENFDSENVVLQILNKVESEHESEVQLTLVQAILKSDKMEAAIKGAVEVGVAFINPLIAKRNVSDIDRKTDKKIDRWQKISEVAAKQSKRDYIPQVSYPIKIEDLEKFDGELIVCYENEEDLRFLDLDIKSKNIALVIGPEGGFEESEIDKLKSYGAHIISLGKRILRAETAAITASYHIINCLEGEK